MDNLAFAFADIARLIRKRFDAERPCGLTGAQWRVLGAVVREPGLNQGQLAERLDVEPITVCRMIDRMQQHGLIERRSDPQDRRSRRLYAAPHAEQLLAQLVEPGEQLVARMTRGMVPADHQALSDLIRVVRANLLDDMLFAPAEMVHG
ncbi:MarR family winged helix-turn-helix transcriptional regulator [Novosphingobium sp.]|uniref:MarR family winged helix-turn-helix transcriptional regulator n=1 Tax=Novosphingobium sp. TaxID=1874826 RepID=UPI002617C0AB|nr:MarR family transcriptional regulator [Novosphingobium sp.]